jgi:hypothetical protein
MSIISQARRELEIINFGEEDTEVMIEILRKFFDQWDSGGAVWAVAPILQRCIAGKPLSPITDNDWMEVETGVYQNKRCSTVFKNMETNVAYDIDNPKGPREQITFPYWPERSNVSSPVVEI